jgi:hypothetical protein
MVMHTAYLKTKVNQFGTGIKCGKIRVQLICSSIMNLITEANKQ